MSDNRKHDELAGILLHQLRNLIDGNQARASEVVPGQYEAEDFRVRLFVLWSFSGTMEDSVTAGDVLMADHFGYNGAAFAPQALSDLLARSGAEFCGEKIPFDLNGEQAGEKAHGMSYVGISTAVMPPFGLKGKTYICHEFSNLPYPYVRPTVFDDLFADELAFLQTNLFGKRKLGKKDAVVFSAAMPDSRFWMMPCAKSPTAARRRTKIQAMPFRRPAKASSARKWRGGWPMR